MEAGTCNFAGRSSRAPHRSKWQRPMSDEASRSGGCGTWYSGELNMSTIVPVAMAYFSESVRAAT